MQQLREKYETNSQWNYLFVYSMLLTPLNSQSLIV